jgi:hypothetical protein
MTKTPDTSASAMPSTPCSTNDPCFRILRLFGETRPAALEIGALSRHEPRGRGSPNLCLELSCSVQAARCSFNSSINCGRAWPSTRCRPCGSLGRRRRASLRAYRCLYILLHLHQRTVQRGRPMTAVTRLRPEFVTTFPPRCKAASYTCRSSTTAGIYAHADAVRRSLPRCRQHSGPSLRRREHLNTPVHRQLVPAMPISLFRAPGPYRLGTRLHRGRRPVVPQLPPGLSQATKSQPVCSHPPTRVTTLTSIGPIP